MKKGILLTISLLAFQVSGASGFECLDHENTPQENAACYSQTYEQALQTTCADHESTPEEIQKCKNDVRDYCFDHEARPHEILACIEFYQFEARNQIEDEEPSCSSVQ